MNSLALVIALLSNPDLMVREAHYQVGQNNFESAAAALTYVNPRYVNDKTTYYFVSAITAFSLNDQSRAKPACEYLIDDFGEVPVRYRVLANLMLNDMKEWKKNDLGDISRKMGDVSKRLVLSKGGPDTKKKQKEILESLDRLIKEAEDQKDQKEKQKQQQQESAKQEPGKNSEPQKDSQIALDKSKGEINQKKIKDLTSVWGKLPEKERATALIELTRDMPPQYREAVRSYFIRISRRSSQTTKP